MTDPENDTQEVRNDPAAMQAIKRSQQDEGVFYDLDEIDPQSKEEPAE